MASLRRRNAKLAVLVGFSRSNDSRRIEFRFVRHLTNRRMSALVGNLEMSTPDAPPSSRSQPSARDGPQARHPDLLAAHAGDVLRLDLHHRGVRRNQVTE